jgi:hypothetical protein
MIETIAVDPSGERRFGSALRDESGGQMHKGISPCLRCRRDNRDAVKHVTAHPSDMGEFVRGQDMMNCVVSYIDIISRYRVTIG